MANSDNTFGTHNKVTYVWTQTDTSWDMGHPSSIALSNPCRVVSAANHGLTDASKVTFADIVGTTELNGNTYYAKKINETTFDLYTDSGLSAGLDASGFTAYAGDDSGSITGVFPKTVFADTDAAINYFLTDEGKAVFNETATQLQWALVNDGNGDATNLKHTIAFGTKGASDQDPAQDWAEQFLTRRTTLSDANGFGLKPWTSATSDDHLF
jgi:hypothetical protein